MRISARIAVGTLACLLGLGGCAATETNPQPSESSTPSSPEAFAAALTKATNETRVALDLPPLRRSACLEREAEKRAEALVGKPLRHAPLDDVVEHCAPGGRVAENLTRTTATADEVVDAWMDSPGHRNNIIDPALYGVGVACVDGGDGLRCSKLVEGLDRPESALRMAERAVTAEHHAASP